MFARFEAALLVGLTWLAADAVPTFNVEPFCRAVASRASPVGDKEICLQKEREARDQLVQHWSRFPPADKAYCARLASIGGDPTYTELLTCLELRQDARRLREEDEEKQEGTTRASPRRR
jgi:hypothetical protein